MESGHILTLLVGGQMNSGGQIPITISRIMDFESFKHAKVLFLSDLIIKKDATSNKRYCEVAINYADLHDICTGLHISFVIQCWRNSSMPKTSCKFHTKYNRWLHDILYSVC